MLLSDKSSNPVILIDRNYQIWVEGIAWSEQAVAVMTSG
jgi:hypothetical protein